MSIRAKVYKTTFESETRAGKNFDLLVFLVIIASIIVVLLDSVSSIHSTHGLLLRQLEWAFTIFFAIEYILRVWSCPYRRHYIFSFYGIIDFLSIIPTPIGYFFGGAESLLIIRSLRLLRVFRVLKLMKYSKQQAFLHSALRQSSPKIVVFLFSILSSITVIGAIMYLIEGAESGFTSIPRAMYWAVVTMTTVGYGDIAPQTVLGQFFASAVMILGYSVIAVPTGIVSAEFTKTFYRANIVCKHCATEGHQPDAAFCRSCGGKLS